VGVVVGPRVALPPSLWHASIITPPISHVIKQYGLFGVTQWHVPIASKSQEELIARSASEHGFIHSVDVSNFL